MKYHPEDILLASTKKLLDIRSGAADVDDRDSLRNQTLHTTEDLFSERIEKDAGGIGRKMLWKATNKGNLSGMPAGALSSQLEGHLLNSGLASPLEEINPIDIFDQLTRISRMGEGGIPNVESIPDEARNVQPSYLGFIDPLRSSESAKIGVDLRATFGTYKGSDGKMYGDMRNLRTGEIEKFPANKIQDYTIAFPGELESEGKYARVIRNGKLSTVPKTEVDYEVPSTNRMFHPSLGMVPLFSAAQGNRPFMAGKLFSQSMALQSPETPLVQTEAATGVTFQRLMGTKAGAVSADSTGVVESITPDKIVVRTAKGKKEYELYNEFPLNRKSKITNRPVVELGQTVKPGQVLAASNYTADDGTLAMGKNLRVAFMPHSGLSVSGDTKVLWKNTDGSIRYSPIRDVAHAPGVTAWAYDHENFKEVGIPVKAFIAHHTKVPMVRTKTLDGSTVVTTKCHSFVTLNDDGELVPVYPEHFEPKKTVLPVIPLSNVFTGKLTSVHEKALRKTNAGDMDGGPLGRAT